MTQSYNVKSCGATTPARTTRRKVRWPSSAAVDGCCNAKQRAVIDRELVVEDSANAPWRRSHAASRWQHLRPREPAERMRQRSATWSRNAGSEASAVASLWHQARAGPRPALGVQTNVRTMLEHLMREVAVRDSTTCSRSPAFSIRVTTVRRRSRNPRSGRPAASRNARHAMSHLLAGFVGSNWWRWLAHQR